MPNLKKSFLCKVVSTFITYIWEIRNIFIRNGHKMFFYKKHFYKNFFYKSHFCFFFCVFITINVDCAAVCVYLKMVVILEKLM